MNAGNHIMLAQSSGNIQRTKPVPGCTCQRQSSWPRLGAVPLAAAAIALLTAFSGNARAQTVINWTGGTSTGWTTGSNWDGGNAPANDLTTNIAGFNNATYSFQPLAPSNRQIAGIQVGASSGAVTIDYGGNLVIGASGITVASGAGSLTLGASVNDFTDLGASQTWVNNSASTWSVRRIRTTAASTHTLTLSGSGGFSAVSSITQTGAGPLEVVMDSSGTFALAGATFTGGLTVKQGTVSTGVGDFGGSGNIVTMGFNGGTTSAALSVNVGGNNITYARSIVLASGHTAGDRSIISTGAANSSSTWTGGVTGTGDLIVQNDGGVTSPQFFSGNGLNFTGNLTKRGAGPTELAAANTFGGIALVEAGTLRLANVNALQNATLDTGTSGSQSVTFTVAGTNTYNLGGLQGADDLAIADNTISVGANGGNTTFSGAISGTGGALTKTGIGRLTLAGANTYTGATSVQQGVLLVDGSTAAGSAVSVSSGAVFGGNGTVSGNLTLDSGALFAFDTGSTLDLTGTFALDNTFGVASLRNTSGGTVAWASINTGTYTLMNTSFSFNAGNISNFGAGNQATGLAGGKSAYFQQGTTPTSSLELVVVPEPGTLALAGVGIGLAGFAVWRRRRG